MLGNKSIYDRVLYPNEKFIVLKCDYFSCGEGKKCVSKKYLQKTVSLWLNGTSSLNGTIKYELYNMNFIIQ